MLLASLPISASSSSGFHPSVIAARLGHTSVTTVLDGCGHLSEGLDRDAADTLEPPWSQSDVHKMCTLP